VAINCSFSSGCEHAIYIIVCVEFVSKTQYVCCDSLWALQEIFRKVIKCKLALSIEHYGFMRNKVLFFIHCYNSVQNSICSLFSIIIMTRSYTSLLINSCGIYHENSVVGQIFSYFFHIPCFHYNLSLQLSDIIK